jgi:hypothetical protein
MKVEITTPREVEVDAVRITAEIKQEYIDDEDIPADFPGLTGRQLDITLDLNTRKVRGWPEGREAGMHLKLVDSGSYFLLSGNETVKADEGGYVPGWLPSEYGDYLILDVGPDGAVKGWEPDEDDIEEWANVE